MTMTKQDKAEFTDFCRNATDRQLQGIYDKEKSVGRMDYARIALAEANQRGTHLTT